MKRALISVLLVLVLVLIPVGLMSAIQGPPASAQPVQEITLLPPITVTLPIATVTVKLPSDPITVRLPGETVTVPQPGATKTVVVTGPTKTVTAPSQPGATKTLPQATATTSVTSSPGQTGLDHATLEPAPPVSDDNTVLTFPRVELSPIEIVGIGTLALAIIAGLIVLGMYI